MHCNCPSELSLLIQLVYMSSLKAKFHKIIACLLTHVYKAREPCAVLKVGSKMGLIKDCGREKDNEGLEGSGRMLRSEMCR